MENNFNKIFNDPITSYCFFHLIYSRHGYNLIEINTRKKRENLF